MQTKKDFIKQKYKNFMNVLIDKSSLTLEELKMNQKLNYSKI